MKTIHKTGISTILFAIIVCVFFIGFLYWYFYLSIYLYIGIALSLAFVLLILNFFRVPNIKVKKDDTHFLSPAYGKVVDIRQVEETDCLNEKMLRVSIFLSPLDIHINFAPMNARIKHLKYFPGKYWVAWHPKASQYNERLTLQVNKDQYRIVLRLITGKVARRIQWFVQENQDIVQGQQIAFMKFGSRVDIFFPLSVQLLCKVGDKLKGAQSVMAKL